MSKSQKHLVKMEYDSGFNTLQELWNCVLERVRRYPKDQVHTIQFGREKITAKGEEWEAAALEYLQGLDKRN